MDQGLYANHLAILKDELIMALGCTEPIAIAYAAAKARKLLGEMPESCVVYCSGNIVKNVMGVTVPDSGGLKGIDVAAVLGIVGGDPDMDLAVLESVTKEDQEKTKELLKRKFCTCKLIEGVATLYIVVELCAGEHTALVEIQKTHKNITRMEKDGVSVLEKIEVDEENGCKTGDKQLLTVKNILEFADEVKIGDVEKILNRQIEKEKLLRGLVVSNLIAVHQKKYIGSLSAYCGVVSAACGAACGICYMLGYPYEVVCETITNTIATVGGMVCDGAKSSCAAKISTALQTALLGMKMGLHDRAFQPGEGLVEDDVEETIRSIGRMGRDGMHSTDLEILNIMLGN